jgi:hypothetical protein
MSDDFDQELEAALNDAEKALDNGKFKSAMQDLLALSMDEIKGTVPKVSYADYSKLLSVVEMASSKNFAEAKLKDQIVALGEVAVSVAKLVPALAALFA